jgi:hypothetical protein
MAVARGTLKLGEVYRAGDLASVLRLKSGGLGVLGLQMDLVGRSQLRLREITEGTKNRRWVLELRD